MRTNPVSVVDISVHGGDATCGAADEFSFSNYPTDLVTAVAQL
jgi:hypothetical protein